MVKIRPLLGLLNVYYCNINVNTDVEICSNVVMMTKLLWQPRVPKELACQCQHFWVQVTNISHPVELTSTCIFSSVNSLYTSYGTSWETLITYQDILSLVVISFILMACMFDQEVKRGTSKQFACV